MAGFQACNAMCGLPWHFIQLGVEQVMRSFRPIQLKAPGQPGLEGYLDQLRFQGFELAGLR
jgi:hypothetical protein